VQEHHVIDPFISTPLGQNPLELAGLTTTPFVDDRGQARAAQRRKGAHPNSQREEDIHHGQVTALRDAPGLVPGSSQVILAEIHDDGVQPTDLEPLDDTSTVVGDQQPNNDAVDIQRLFEDRAFEGQLLRFIAQRMDPPHRPDSHVYSEEDNPPTYRPV